MSGDLVSLRVLLMSGSMADRDLLRQGVATAVVPVDMLECDSALPASRMLGGNEIDVIFIDTAVAAADRTAVIEEAKAARVRPFIFFLAASKSELPSFTAAGGDGALAKPASADEARTLIERCVRLRLPHRVMVVDDSPTMRSIVRKILLATRFRLDVAEAQEGIEALKQLPAGKFDLIFLDYNMPGLNGVETLSEIKRQYPKMSVVIMTSTTDDIVAEKARLAGAAAFLKKPFYPSDIDAILHRLFGLQAQRLS